MTSDLFIILHPLKSLEWLKLEASNFLHELAIRSVSLAMTNGPPSGCGQAHVTHFSVLGPVISLEWIKLKVVQDRHTYNGKLIGNHMWPTEWHQCQGPWMTSKVHLCSIFHDFNSQCAHMVPLVIWHTNRHFCLGILEQLFLACLRAIHQQKAVGISSLPK